MINKEQKLNYIKSLKKYQQGDKIKQLRDKHPILDFFAGFIPGVGEAQDAHDFVNAAKKGDKAGMSWALLGLALPGLAGGQLRKLAKFGDDVASGGIKKVMNEILPDTLKSKGWKIANDGAFVNPQGRRFIRHEGKLTAEDSVKNIKEAADRKVRQKAAKKAIEKQKKAFEDAAEAFEKETGGLDFSLENWQRLAPGHKMTDVEKHLYTTQAFPGFVESYRRLTQPGKEKLKKVGNKWYGWFDEPVADGISDKLPVLKERWAKGWRELDGKEGAMTYIIAHSDQAKGKFMYNGITMHQGVPEMKDKITAHKNFENGDGDQNFQKWFDSDRSGAPEYSNPDGARGGLKIFGLPIRPSLLYPYMSDRPHLIKRMTTNPQSNNWDGIGSWIGQYIGKNPEKKIHISEGPLIDNAATRSQGHEVKGVFTIVGENIPIKSVFGGSGMYNTEGKNIFKPFMQWAAPIGLTSLIGYKAYDKNEKQVF